MFSRLKTSRAADKREKYEYLRALGESSSGRPTITQQPVAIAAIAEPQGEAGARGMNFLARQLLAAANNGDVAGVRACLAAGADPGVQHSAGLAPSSLHAAAMNGHAECVAALIAGGANTNIRNAAGVSPLHLAAKGNHAGCVQLLLAAGADALAVTSDHMTPLHLAAYTGAANLSVILLLLQAGPAAALARNREHVTPIVIAIYGENPHTARCLLEQGPLPPTGEVLAALDIYDRHFLNAWAQPLFAPLVSRQPLTAEQWGMVPAACTGLGPALPAVLQRSTDEAALLVCRLPADQKQCLRTAALCLARAQRQAGAQLPNPIVWRILAQFALPV